MKEGEKGFAGPCCCGVSRTLVAIVYTETSRDNIRRALEKVGCSAETKEEAEEFRKIVTK